MNGLDLANVRFGPDGLIPVVVQDAASRDVLMLAFMNDEALRLTRATGRAHYWSRGRGKLWRKGESSGNEQIVEDMLINCEQNSLLLQVQQLGAVCHEGFASCYYRALNEDGTLCVVRERIFDPLTVYGTPNGSDRLARELARATRSQIGAYLFLRDNDLTAISQTSLRLHDGKERLETRVADELRELAGVFDGSHRHAGLRSDVLLEASQVIYWVLLTTIRAGVRWDDLRPDRALATDGEPLTAATVARLLERESDVWRAVTNPFDDLSAEAHATIALVGQACRAAGVDPLDVIMADLAELQSRDYLQPYFAHEGP